MKKILFVLVLGVAFFSLVGCQDNQQPPIPRLPPIPPIRKVNVKKIVVYDFWAQWCPPCRAFGPTFEKWKEKYSNENVTFLKVNTDEDQATAVKFKISALPTVVITHDGVEVKRFTGAPTESQVQEFLK